MSKHESESRTVDLMRRKASEVKEPADLPSGDWEVRCGSCKIVRNEEHEPEDANSHQYVVNFMFVPVKPVANVDEDAVADGSWRGKTLFKRFYLRGDADLWEMNKVFTGLGIDLDGRDDYQNELAPLAKNRTAVVTVGLRTFKRRDGTTGKENTLTDFRQAA